MKKFAQRQSEEGNENKGQEEDDEAYSACSDDSDYDPMSKTCVNRKGDDEDEDIEWTNGLIHGPGALWHSSDESSGPEE